jgi:hypothetical protein
MESLLSQAKNLEVFAEPYPHLVASDALDEELGLQLIEELPPVEVITKTTDYPSNKGYAIATGEALANESITPLWRDTLKANSSQQLLDDVIELLGDHILSLYPSFEEEFGALDSLKAGLRYVDTFDDADVLLDAEITVNTPVVDKPSSARSPHVDDTARLFNGQLFLRTPDDTSTGADVELYRFREQPGGFQDRNVDPSFIETVKTVRYERNLLLVMINSLDSVHGVTDRPVTPIPKYLINLIGNVKRPLFDVGPYQVSAAVS